MERSEAGRQIEELPNASRWLAAVPTLSLSRIDSREALGTDETEVSLNLPLKSPSRSRADARLRNLEFALHAARQEVRRLFFSGLVLEAWWSHHLASIKLDGAEQRIDLLNELVEQQQTLTRAGSTPAYASLIVRRELIGARSEANMLRNEMQGWEDRYRSLTGLPLPSVDSVRTNHPEQGPAELPRIAEHPALQLLDLDWQRQQAVFDATTSAAEDWTLGLMGRRVEVPGLNEQQFGLSLEIPLSFVPVVTRSERSDRQASASDYLRSRDELLTQLQQRRSELESERQTLSDQLALLRETVILDDALSTQLTALAAGNAIETEILLRRQMDILTTRTELNLTLARLAENRAMLHQTLGVSP